MRATGVRNSPPLFVTVGPSPGCQGPRRPHVAPKAPGSRRAHLPGTPVPVALSVRVRLIQ